MTETAQTPSEARSPEPSWNYGQPGQPTHLHPYTGAVLPFPIHTLRAALLLVAFGFVVVPLLVAINWRRMGSNGRALGALAAGYGGGFLIGLALGWTIRDTGTLAALLISSSWAVASGLILLQRRAYLAWRTTIPADLSFWRIGCFVYPLVALAVFYILAWSAIAVLQRAAPLILVAFEGESVSFDHPSAWRVDTDPLACGTSDAECVAVVRGIGAGVTLTVVQSEEFAEESTDVVADRLWSSLRLELPVFLEPDGLSADSIGGYEARVYSSTARDTGGSIRIGDQFRVAILRLADDAALMVVGQSTRESAAAVEALIRSIEVRTPAEAADTP